MGPAIFVFPDCFTAFGGNQYVNSPAIGNYADYLTRENHRQYPEGERLSRFRLIQLRQNIAPPGETIADPPGGEVLWVHYCFGQGESGVPDEPGDAPPTRESAQ